jgi:hypothetical protein
MQQLLGREALAHMVRGIWGLVAGATWATKVLFCPVYENLLATRAT